MSAANAGPRRGEIWSAATGSPPRHHWVVVVSVDERNRSDRIGSVLIVPFGSMGIEGPTTLRLMPEETGLPGPSFLKGHFISTERKSCLKERITTLSERRMRQIVLLVRRAIDPYAPPLP